jgi:hypothetical protein
MGRKAIAAMVVGSAEMLAGTSAWGQAAGDSATIEIVPVLVSGVQYPLIGRVESILSIDVNDACWVGARVEAIAPGTDNRREVLVAGPHRGPLFPVVVGGEVVRGTDLRAPLSGFSSFQIGRFGDYSYHAIVTTPQGEQSSAIMWSPGVGSGHFIAARSGVQIPGQPDGFRYRVVPQQHVLGDSGLVAFSTFLVGPGVTFETDGIVVLSRPGSVRLVREGVPLDSLGGRSVVLSPLEFWPVVFGGVHLNAGVSVEGGGTPHRAIISAEPVTIRAQEGWSLRGLPGTTLEQFATYPSVGYAGELVYSARLVGPEVTPANEWMIWLNGYGLVARGGDAAMGQPEGVRYRFFDSPVLYGRERGVMVFSTLAGTGVTDATNTALVAGPAGGIRVIARAGDQAPGVPEGVAFDHFSSSRGFKVAYVNAKGDVVFLNRLRGAGVTAANDLAVFVREAGGPLRLVLREGGTVRVNGADRVVAEILNAAPNQDGVLWMSNGDDGRRTILNRHGECFLAVRFTDGGAALLKAQAASRPCPADFNADRFIDCFDYLDFVVAFEAGDPSADQNEDLFVDFFDYSAFVEVFEAGC